MCPQWAIFVLCSKTPYARMAFLPVGLGRITPATNRIETICLYHLKATAVSIAK